MTNHSRYVTVLLLAFLSVFAWAQHPNLRIELRPEAVDVSHVVPRTSVLLYGFLIEGKGYYPEQRQLSLVREDVDGDGVVTYDLGRTIPNRAFFVAVDLTNGRWQVVTPMGFEYQQIDLPESAFVAREGKPVAFRIPAAVVDALHVRPGGGAWSHRSGDGGAGDDDGRVDGGISMAAGKFRPVHAGGTSDGEFRPNDIVIAVDVLRRQYSVRRMVQ
jgi:hypothetical protein